ncbi:MAG: hypothetical protein HOP28_12560 [Gemmatimonadales bacterium]|nr:hypothetical protein [Gemmatimonadales bacterium]
MTDRLDRALTLGAALLLVAFGFFPVANWIPGGHEAPWYGPVAADLLTGLSISIGAGVVLAIASRHFGWLWREGALTPLGGRIGHDWSRTVAVVAAAAFIAYLIVAREVFDGRPLLIDEIIQVFQGRTLAAGHLWLPAAPHQEFFSSLHLVEQDGRVYGQFPVGGPAMLALGTLAGAEWLVGPVSAAIAVIAFGGLIRRVEPRPLVALAALLLFALAPFMVFMSGSHMNHVTALACLTVGMLGLVRSALGDTARFGDGLLAGLGFGLAATIRPVDAAAFALPAGIWLLWRAVTLRRLAPLIGAGIGVALPVVVLAWANLQTTGAPFRFGYSVLWGQAHNLGFHITPWGAAHTPARGLELLSLYFLRLQTYLFESAAPSLIPAVAALWFTKRLAPFDRYLLMASGLLAVLYFAYWHDGFYLGPRFLFPLLPVLAVWSARFLPALAMALGTGVVTRAAAFATIVAVGLGLATSLPLRTRQYREGMISLRWDPDRAAEGAGVRNALVFVRESWGAELVTRMWALGISRPDADAIYRAADPCRLELGLSALERGEMRGGAARNALLPLLADSARLMNAESITGDPSLRLTPGVEYAPACIAKLEANRAGFTLYPPLLLARKFGNVYARDLGGRDTLLLAQYPDRPLYLLKPASTRVGEPPRFVPLSRDSLLLAARSGR